MNYIFSNTLIQAQIINMALQSGVLQLLRMIFYNYIVLIPAYHKLQSDFINMHKKFIFYWVILWRCADANNIAAIYTSVELSVESVIPRLFINSML